MKKLAVVILLVLGALPLIIYPFVLLANVMGFAAPRSGNESFSLVLISYLFYISTLVYPIVYLGCAGFAIAWLRKKTSSALGCALGPIGYLFTLLALGGIWMFAEKGLSTVQVLQERSAASHLSECTPPALLDNGDGFSTTACAALEIGGTGTGVISTASEAHNWSFKVELKPLTATRFTITLKNDGKSCPDLTILDSSGLPAAGFDHPQHQAVCPQGVNTTSFHYFSPPGSDTYILRVYTPETPGAYWLKIEQK
jgi:hypothetical protein